MDEQEQEIIPPVPEPYHSAIFEHMKKIEGPLMTIWSIMNETMDTDGDTPQSYELQMGNGLFLMVSEISIEDWAKMFNENRQ